MRLTRLGLIHAFRKIRGERLGHIAHGGWCEALAIIGRHETERGLALAHRLFEDRVEHRREVTGRRIDDLQYLGRRRLLIERCGKLCLALTKPAPQFGNLAFKLAGPVVPHRHTAFPPHVPTLPGWRCFGEARLMASDQWSAMLTPLGGAEPRPTPRH